MKSILSGFLAVLLGLLGFSAGETPLEVSENEFVVQVTLDTPDVVCMLSCAYMLNGELTGGRTGCAADGRTPMGKTEYEVFQPEDFPEAADLSGFSILFYLNDRFESDVSDTNLTIPAHAVPVENEIVIPATYGSTYSVVIQGDRENGYRASLEG